MRARFGDERLPERFWAKVQPEPMSGCWLWAGACDLRGYGYSSIKGMPVATYRWAYRALVGAIGPGLELDHLCRVRCCCNPLHMEPVTHRENTLRGDTVTAANARKEACSAGHPFDAENTYVRPNGRRKCRACHRQQERRRKRAIRAASPTR